MDGPCKMGNMNFTGSSVLDALKVDKIETVNIVFFIQWNFIIYCTQKWKVFLSDDEKNINENEAADIVAELTDNEASESSEEDE